MRVRVNVVMVFQMNKQLKEIQLELYWRWWFDGEILWWFIEEIEKERGEWNELSVTSYEIELYHKIITIRSITATTPTALNEITINIISYTTNDTLKDYA